MTNKTIVWMERVRLMDEGIIGGTGRTVEIETEDGVKTFEEPEEIFTVKEWNKRGFLIKTGETHIAEFCIWKHESKGKKANAENPEDSEESEESEITPKSNGRKRHRRNNGFYFGKACFFKASQVTLIPAKEA